ncbi:MAG: hypothetical protein EA380_02490 [Phycisphaeraceae bacterium]|nr:MAG: hypothetical protein EA380_02490 [Phycisphaeraceae bacterium]
MHRIAIGTLLFAVGSAHAAIIDPWMSDGPGGIDPLVLANGEWTFGPLSGGPQNDWWVPPGTSTFMIREIWGTSAATPGAVVDFLVGAEADTRAITPIGIMKDVENQSTFFWDGFVVDLIPGQGATISNVVAFASAEFGSVNVIDNGDGSWTLVWDQNGGTGVGIGGSTDLDFNFDIDGAINFQIIQTAIPTPGAVALLGLGGLAALRRRR